MRKGKEQRHEQLDPPHTSTGACRVIWHNTPPSPAQLAAWRQLWARLLGHVGSSPETRQPQDGDPGATVNDRPDAVDVAATTRLDLPLKRGNLR
jgi:hypothetical protein